MTQPNKEVPSRENIADWLRDWGKDEVLLADGFEEAFIGVVRKMGQPDVACYDINTMRTVLMFRDGMTADEADEYLEYNTLGAYVGENTPAFLVRYGNPMVLGVPTVLHPDDTLGDTN